MNPSIALVALALYVPVAHAAELRSIDTPLKTGNKAPADAAVVIGVENYWKLPQVPYAIRDATAFYDWAVYTRGIPLNRVERLDNNPGADEIAAAVKRAGAQTSGGGTVWLYFSGHGMAARDGRRMILGGGASGANRADLEQGGAFLDDLEAEAGARGARVVAIVDACYTGEKILGDRTPVPPYSPPRRDVVEWLAAAANETSGPLEAAGHGAFTYFALGALRGWADGQLDRADGRVLGSEAQLYVESGLKAARITGQRPEMRGEGWSELELTRGATEQAPSLAALSTEVAPVTAPRTGEAVIVTDGKDLDFEALARRVKASEAEAAEEKHRAAEAARVLADKEAAAKALKAELERRLAAERREKIDVAAAELRAAATRDYTAISGMVASPSKEAKPVLEAYVSRYRGAKVTIDSVSEAVAIAEVPKVEAAIAKLNVVAAPAPAPVPSTGSSTASASKYGVDVRVVDTMLRSNKSVKVCFVAEKSRTGELPKDVKVKFTIQPSGKVTKAALSGGTLAGSAFDTCLSAAVLTIQFPPFSGDPVTLTYPFKL